MKTCSMCHKLLDLESFARNANMPDGLQKACKECHKKYYRSYKAKYGQVFVVWKSMLQRCRDKNSKDYSRYGGRGIKVCDAWQRSVAEFSEWAYANGYQHGLDIDRIDNDGDYSPENCHFVARAINIRHRSTTILTAAQVQRIKSLLKSGKYLQREIAEMFHATKGAVDGIRQGKSWKDIPPLKD